MNGKKCLTAHLWVLILTGSFFGTSLALSAQDLPPAEQPEQSFELLNNLVEVSQLNIGCLQLTNDLESRCWVDLRLLSRLGFRDIPLQTQLAGPGDLLLEHERSPGKRAAANRRVRQEIS